MTESEFLKYASSGNLIKVGSPMHGKEQAARLCAQQMVIPAASHTDLYDQLDKIPFEAMTVFFNEYMK